MTTLFGDVVRVADILAAGFEKLVEKNGDKFSPQPGLMFVATSSQSPDRGLLYLCHLLEVMSSTEDKVTLQLTDTHSFVETFTYSEFQELKRKIVARGLAFTLQYQAAGCIPGISVGSVYFKPPETTRK